MIRKGHTTADHVVASLAALAAAALVSSALATPPGEVEPQSRAPSAAPAPVGSEARATRQGGPLETYGFAERKPRPRYA